VTFYNPSESRLITEAKTLKKIPRISIKRKKSMEKMLAAFFFFIKRNTASCKKERKVMMHSTIAEKDRQESMSSWVLSTKD
jgi:uncharacterized protein YdaU (DUF1376 family)